MDLIIALVGNRMLIAVDKVFEMHWRAMLVNGSRARHSGRLTTRLQLEPAATVHSLAMMSCRGVLFASVATHNIDLCQVKLLAISFNGSRLFLQNARTRLAYHLTRGYALNDVFADESTGSAISDSVRGICCLVATR